MANLDVDKLAQFFDERVKDARCPFCKSNDWALPMIPGTAGLCVPWGRGEDYYLMSGWPAVMIYCKCCGFMRMHSLEALEGVLIKDDSGSESGA